MNLRYKTILNFSTLLACVGLQATLTVGGYYENWSQYRNINSGGTNRGVFPSCTPQGFSIIAKNLNILNYCFWMFHYDRSNTSGPTVSDWKVYPSEWNDYTNYGDGGLLAQSADLKGINNTLKTMVSIGGWNFICPTSNYGQTTLTYFTQLLANSNYQDQFIDSLTNKTNNPQTTGWFWRVTPNGNYYMDGIDIDYEYPGQLNLGGASTQNNPNAANDYQGFIDFITKLRTAINTINDENCARPKLYLSITLPPFLPSNLAAGSTTSGTYPAGTPLAGKNYPAITINPSDPSTYFAWYSIIANHCDWVNLMTYDMYGAGFSSLKVQYEAPLYNTYQQPYNATQIPDNTTDGAYSIDYAVWMWTTGAKQGASSSLDGIGIGPSQILLGLPSYGRSYGSNTTIFNSNPLLQSYETYNAPDLDPNTGVPTGDPVVQTGGAFQPYTKAYGTAAYFEITPLVGNALKMSLNSNPLSSFGSSVDQAQSYFVANQTKTPNPSNNVFVYDSPSDIAKKVAYAKQQGLGGIFFYALSEDNFPMNAVSTTGYNPQNTLFQSALNEIKVQGSNSNGIQQYSNKTAN